MCYFFSVPIIPFRTKPMWFVGTLSMACKTSRIWSESGWLLRSSIFPCHPSPTVKMDTWKSTWRVRRKNTITRNMIINFVEEKRHLPSKPRVHDWFCYSKLVRNPDQVSKATLNSKLNIWSLLVHLHQKEVAILPTGTQCLKSTQNVAFSISVFFTNFCHVKIEYFWHFYWKCKRSLLRSQFWKRLFL